MSIAEKFASMEYGPAPEDPKESLAWLERHGRRFGLFIGGEWQPPANGGYFDTLDPSTGEFVVTELDGAWARDPFANSSHWRLVEKSGRGWRIYRAQPVGLAHARARRAS